MNHLTLKCGTLFAVTALALGGLALPTNGAESDMKAPHSDKQTYQMNEKDAADSKTLQGRVVNLQQFLLADTDIEAVNGHGGEIDKPQNRASKDGPLGLCVKEEGMIDALSTEQTYLILFNPDNDAQADAYDDARDLIGKQVTLTGKVVERASISGVVINSVEQDTTSQASAQNQRP